MYPIRELWEVVVADLASAWGHSRFATLHTYYAYYKGLVADICWTNHKVALLSRKYAITIDICSETLGTLWNIALTLC